MLPAESLRAVRNTVSSGGLPGNLAQIVAQGADNPIRTMDEDRATAVLSLLVPKIAKAYGNRSELDQFTVEQCVVAVLDDFAHLGIDELLTAYQLWANGKIQGPEMWGGQFSATQWGRVLQAYDEHRRQIWAALERAHDAEREKARQERQAEKNAEFSRRFPEYLDRELANRPEKYGNWRQVPEFWYEPALAHGMIAWEPGEMTQRFKAALQQADADKAKRLSMELGAFSRLTLERTLTNTRKSRARVIARKRAVWDKIVTKYVNDKSEEE